MRLGHALTSGQGVACLRVSSDAPRKWLGASRLNSRRADDYFFGSTQMLRKRMGLP